MQLLDTGWIDQINIHLLLIVRATGTLNPLNLNQLFDQISNNCLVKSIFQWEIIMCCPLLTLWGVQLDNWAYWNLALTEAPLAPIDAGVARSPPLSRRGKLVNKYTRHGISKSDNKPGEQLIAILGSLRADTWRHFGAGESVSKGNHKELSAAVKFLTFAGITKHFFQQSLKPCRAWFGFFALSARLLLSP
jgi:hypothetical protein